MTTTDPTGKPVAAEVSLAMVERWLLDRFPGGLPSIGDFFRGEPRQPSVRTTASIRFQYRPATHPIDRNLLAERQRLEVEEEERLSRVMRGVGVNSDAGLVGQITNDEHPSAEPPTRHVPSGGPRRANRQP